MISQPFMKFQTSEVADFAQYTRAARRCMDIGQPKLAVVKSINVCRIPGLGWRWNGWIAPFDFIRRHGRDMNFSPSALAFGIFSAFVYTVLNISPHEINSLRSRTRMRYFP